MNGVTPSWRQEKPTSAAVAAAREKDAYVADWARAGSAARCDAPDWAWMARFPAIDVGCRIIIDNVGLTS